MEQHREELKALKPAEINYERIGLTVDEASGLPMIVASLHLNIVKVADYCYGNVVDSDPKSPIRNVFTTEL
jgi:hypothetical protein